MKRLKHMAEFTVIRSLLTFTGLLDTLVHVQNSALPFKYKVADHPSKINLPFGQHVDNDVVTVHRSGPRASRASEFTQPWFQAEGLKDSASESLSLSLCK